MKPWVSRLAILLTLQAATRAQQPDRTISTYAGGGPDNVAAITANISPAGIVPAAGGAFYVSSGAFVFLIDASGHLSVAAGNGVSTLGADDGPAIRSALGLPRQLAIDRHGNLLIADAYSRRIRRIDAATGMITTVAGNGTFDYAGDGVPATQTGLNAVVGVAVDAADNVYVSGGARVLRVDAATNIITTIAGTGAGGFAGDGGPATAARLNQPGGVVVDTIGNVFVVDWFNHRIRRVDAETGIITTVAGSGPVGYENGSFSGDGGPATSATLNLPSGISVDAVGNLLIADSLNRRIRRVDASTGIIDTLIGTGPVATVTGGGGPASGDGGPAGLAALAGPTAVAIDASRNLLIGDSLLVRRVDAATQIITAVAGNGEIAFSGEGVPALHASLSNGLFGLALDRAGNLFIADSYNHRIRRVDAGTHMITTIAGTGVGGFDGDGGSAKEARLRSPAGLAFDGLGNLYVADTGNNRVRRITPGANDLIEGETDETVSTFAGNGVAGGNYDEMPAIDSPLDHPADVAVDHAGNVFIADSGNRQIRRVDLAGRISTYCGRFLTFCQPFLVARVAVSPTGDVFFGGVRDAFLPRTEGVFRVSAAGAAPDYWVTARDGGQGLAFDAVGNLYVADRSRIRMADHLTLGTSVIAGTGTFGFSGDGGDALLALLSTVNALVASDLGDVYIGDGDNWRVRLVTSTPPRDTEPPTIVIQSPSPTSYTLNQVVISSYACTDTVTLNPTCTGPVPNGAAIDTASIGHKTFLVSSQDAAGNHSSASVPYAIVYQLYALYDPSRAAKIGSTLPIKLQLYDALGTNTSSPSVVLSAISVRKVSDISTTDVIDAGNSAPDSNFRFDASLGGTGGYIFNLKTTGLTSGTYALVFSVTGESEHREVRFVVR